MCISRKCLPDRRLISVGNCVCECMRDCVRAFVRSSCAYRDASYKRPDHHTDVSIRLRARAYMCVRVRAYVYDCVIVSRDEDITFILFKTLREALTQSHKYTQHASLVEDIESCTDIVTHIQAICFIWSRRCKMRIPRRTHTHKKPNFHARKHLRARAHTRGHMYV